jgi:1-acyl-sn-glycerol-3-phosphate acyltransferase
MLRGIWAACVLVVASALLALPATIVTLLSPRGSNAVIRAGKIWSRIMLATVGARVTYHDPERAHERAPCVFIANHQSMIDIWVMFAVIPLSTRFVAKHELFRIPVFGWALSSCGCIAIDRSNRREALRSLRAAADQIRAGRSVVLYPEGSRSRDGRLRPFKKGAFHLALQAGVPIVPVVITGSNDVMPPRSRRVRPGPVDVHLEPPVDVRPFQPSDYAGLLAEVHATFARRFERAGSIRDDGEVHAIRRESR